MYGGEGKIWEMAGAAVGGELQWEANFGGHGRWRWGEF
jgi:hypothetical protein